MTAAAETLSDPVLDLIHAIGACPDDAALLALLPRLRTELGVTHRPSALALLVEVVERTRSAELLDGEVRRLIGEWQMVLRPGQRGVLAEAVAKRRKQLVRDAGRQLSWG